jgi:phospholipid transport system transporter-binding protein
MSEQFSINYDRESGVVHIAGELSFSTANAVLADAQQVFDNASKLDIDLSAVTRSDSAGVALLVDWMRNAKQNSKKIVFHNVPAQMLAIASASGLDEALPVQ